MDERSRGEVPRNYLELSLDTWYDEDTMQQRYHLAAELPHKLHLVAVVLEFLAELLSQVNDPNADRNITPRFHRGSLGFARSFTLSPIYATSILKDLSISLTTMRITCVPASIKVVTLSALSTTKGTVRP